MYEMALQYSENPLFAYLFSLQVIHTRKLGIAGKLMIPPN